ncbi:MAG: thermonuclease family protein, partial [Sphingomonadaceae bacterium]
MTRPRPRFHHDRRRGRMEWRDPPPPASASLVRRAGRLLLGLAILGAAILFTLREWQHMLPSRPEVAQPRGTAGAAPWTAPAGPVPPAAGSKGASLAGVARVHDGDTISIGTTRIRLQGIDAPEFGQMCTDAAGQPYDCGRRAADELVRWLAGRPLDCARRGTDRHGRVLARCVAPDGADLGAAMLRAGWAVTFARGDLPYAALEAEASAARRGLWAGRFERPQAWRDAQEAARRAQSVAGG